MKKLFTLLFIVTLFSSLIIAQGDSDETLFEQQKAFESELNPVRHNISIVPGAFFGVTNPLFVGVDDVNVPAYVGEPSLATWDSVFSGLEVWGAAYDNINDKIYFNDGTLLYEWPVGGTPAFVDTINDGLGANLSMVALAGYNGVLYGTRNVGNEAVYIIDPATGIATVHIDYAEADFDFGGLAVDPTTGDFYGTSDDNTPLPRGLYKINPDGTGTLVAPYPAGQTDIDGLAMSQSQIAYLITDEQDSVYIYDVPGTAYLPAIPTPWTSSEVFCGGTWNTGIIPVELSSFAASVNGNDVTLNWTTATETNNSGFEIERKLNGNYKTVGFVPGFGTTTETKIYSFQDENLQPGTYMYRLRQIDFNGTSEYSDLIEVDVIAPAEFSLNQNYPNPFNPSTKITFGLAEDSKVTLTIFNVLGQEVSTVLNSDLAAGQHEVNFNASGLNSGIYFYKLSAVGQNGKEFSSVKKMTLTK